MNINGIMIMQEDYTENESYSQHDIVLLEICSCLFKIGGVIALFGTMYAPLFNVSYDR